MTTTSTRLLRQAGVIGLAVWALAPISACASDDDAGDATPASTSMAYMTTTYGPAGPAAPTSSTTMAPTSSTTDGSAPVTTGEPGEVALPLAPPPISANATDPAGDGCSPTNGNVLPDGTWYGQLRPTGSGPAPFGLDLACFFTGDAADAAALADDPAAEVPVPNGYHVRNQADTVYALVDGGTATVYLLDPTGGSELQPAVTGIATAAPAIEAWSGPVDVWVVVQAGQVTLLQQQYRP